MAHRRQPRPARHVRIAGPAQDRRGSWVSHWRSTEATPLIRATGQCSSSVWHPAPHVDAATSPYDPLAVAFLRRPGTALVLTTIVVPIRVWAGTESGQDPIRLMDTPALLVAAAILLVCTL